MRTEVELKEWNFKIPGIGFEKRVCLPYTWNTEERMEVQLYRGQAEYTSDLQRNPPPSSERHASEGQSRGKGIQHRERGTF